jgi:hypothetical protein
LLYKFQTTLDYIRRKRNYASDFRIYSTVLLMKRIHNRETRETKTMRWAGHVEHMVDMRNAYTILEINPEGKSAIGRDRRRLDWIQPAQNRVQWDVPNTVIKLWVPYTAGNFLT